MPRYEDYDQSLHQAALILGDPVAEAFEWMKHYAENLSDQCKGGYDEDQHYSGVTLEELLRVADSHQPDQNTKGWGGNYISRGGVFEGVQTDPTFWKKYAIFREIPIEDVDQSSFFSCSC